MCEQELKHSDGQAEHFSLGPAAARNRGGRRRYRIFTLVRALLAGLGFQVWMGNPRDGEAKLKKRKTDRELARLLLN
jgi:hypothetical protein